MFDRVLTDPVLTGFAAGMAFGIALGLIAILSMKG